MSTRTHSYRRFLPSRRALIIAAIICLIAALAVLYIWIATAQTIAPPGLRILDFFWTILSG